MIWITSVSCATIAESPPVAMTFISSPKLLAEALDHALHHAHIAKQQTRLHGMDGVAANDGRRALQVDARKFCGVYKERFGGEVDAGRDRAAQIFSLFGQRIEGGGCSKIDHAGGSPI